MDHSIKSIVFVTDTPSIVKKILAPHVSGHWPDYQIFYITTGFGVYEFRYPRGLPFSALPYVAEPSWKLRTGDYSFWGIWRFDAASNAVISVDLELSTVLIEAETICYASNPHGTSVAAYQQVITQCLGAEALRVGRPAVFLESMDSQNCERMIRELGKPDGTLGAEFLRLASYGAGKRFFDFNFNVNSLALFGACLRQVGVVKPDYGMSKYSLQLLYKLRKAQPMTIGNVLHLIADWPGTGRYGIARMGSVVSSGAIIDGLVDAGLLTASAIRNTKNISISERGQAFLRLLHPGCEDQDLPARIDEWCGDWPASRPKVEKYLRTFFGRQKRFAG